MAVKLIAGRVRYWFYRSFLSYREYSGGGGVKRPPPVKRGVKGQKVPEMWMKNVKDMSGREQII